MKIDTTSAKYQNYMTGLSNLKKDMLPQFEAFSKLSREKQRWWLQRDPLMRRVLKFMIMLNKWVDAQGFMENVEDD